MSEVVRDDNGKYYVVDDNGDKISPYFDNEADAWEWKDQDDA